jgi:hypothetical protein
MPRANLQQVFDGLSLGVFESEQVVRCADVIMRLFPHHHLTFVHSKDDTEVFIYPRLTKEQQERWDAVYEALCRELGTDC